jgi:hypothetical protein
VSPGEIHYERSFYVDPDTGEYRGKYILILAKLPGGDFVARLLTSRQHGRPKNPPCYHGDPYPGFYLGVIGGQLGADSWLDLRALEDFDGRDLARHSESGSLNRVAELDPVLFRQAADCVARANDTTRLQERAIRDTLALRVR